MYDQAAQMPIMNTYVPINFGELYRIAATQKQDLDTAQQQLQNAVQKFGEFVSPSDIDTQNYHNLSIGQFDDLLDRAAANPELMKDRGFLASIQSRINNLDYSALSRLKKGAENLNARNKMAAELRAKGLFKDSWDVYFDSQGNMRKFDASNYDTLSQGILDQLSPIEYKSLRDIVSPYVDKLKPHFIQGNVDPLTGRAAPFTKGYMAITESDIRDILDRSVNEIMQTPQGQMWYRDIANTVRAINPDATNEDIFNAFAENMYDDARYKLYSQPIDDEYAQQEALWRLRLSYANRKGSGTEETPLRTFGQDSIMAQDSASDLRRLVFTVRDSKYKGEIESKFDPKYNEVRATIDGIVQKASNNPTFSAAYNRMMNQVMQQFGQVPPEYENIIIEESFKQAAQLDPTFDKSLEVQLNQQKDKIKDIQKEENKDALGIVMYDTIKTTLDLEGDENPFKNRSKDGNRYTESLLRRGYQDAVYNVMTPVNTQVGSDLLKQRYPTQSIVSGVGYEINPNGRLITPAQFVAQNSYIQQKAKEGDFDLNLTYTHRDYPELESEIANGALGTAAISDVLGYIDTEDCRNYVVNVNVPLSEIYSKYDNHNMLAFFGGGGGYRSYMNNVAPDELNINYPVTTKSDEGDSGKKTKWSEGYVTVKMILPEKNTNMGRYMMDRTFEDQSGTSGTKEAISSQNTSALENILNYQIDFNIQ